MEAVRKGDSKVAGIIGRKSCNQEARYRLSDFCIYLSENGVNLVKNTLSYEVIRLSDAEWEALQEIRDRHADFSFIKAHGLEELARTRLLMEEDSDDAELYAHTLNILRMMEPKKKGYRTYTILPTTDCNARCTYCYEEGCTRKTMTRATAQRLVDFICETRCNGRITLNWFGGEPLLCPKTISFICQALDEKQVPFHSSLVTNASLVTAELAKEMKEVWKLKEVQVSLDGDRRDYVERKRYLQPEKYTYDGVLKAIHILADAGFFVKLRVNVDEGNIGRIEGFLNEMNAEFSKLKNVTLYLAILFQEHQNENALDLCRKKFELEEALGRLELRHTQEKPGRKSPRLHSCMADNMDASIQIAPDGSFHKCEHDMEGYSWGNIFDGVTDQALLEKLKSPAAIDDECRHCPSLPECTPFRRRHCPCTCAWCREEYLQIEKTRLRRIIKSLNNPGGKN